MTTQIGYVESLKQIYELQQKICKPFVSIQKIYEPVESVQKLIIKMCEPVESVQKLIIKMCEPVESVQKSIRKIYEPIESWRKLKKPIEDFISVANDINKYLPFLEELRLVPKKKSRYWDYEAGLDREFKDTIELEDEIEYTEAIVYKNPIRTNSSIVMIDKLSDTLFGMKRYTPNMTFCISTGNRKGVSILCNIDFCEADKKLNEKAMLNHYDKQCYEAIATLYKVGNEIVSLTQVYYAMGHDYKVKPGGKSLEKVNNSITKMSMIRIYIDNSKEVALYKNYNKFIYNGRLLPIERKPAKFKSKLSKKAIYILQDLPLMKFAYDRKQIEEISIEEDIVDISKTDFAIKVKNYLIKRISEMKRYKKTNHPIMLHSTLCNKLDLDTKEQKKRGLSTIKTYLEKYKSKSRITDYRMLGDRIEVDI